MTSRHLFLLCLTVTLSGAITIAQNPKASVQSAPGFSVTTFETTYGRIRVSLPDDLAAGDVISGTVTAEPKGKDNDEKRSNSQELNGFVVSIANHKVPGSGSAFPRLVIPATTAISITLADLEGKEIGRSSIPVKAGPVSPGQSNFTAPTLGQSGEPLVISGQFDGDLSNTRASIGGQNAVVLAESRRKVILANPLDVVGPTTIEVNEGAAKVSGPLRNLKVSLVSVKTSVAQGESVTLFVQVSGLGGITTPTKVLIRNSTPSIVTMAGGNTQTIQIPVDQVPAKGMFYWRTTLTGTANGEFSVSGSVETDASSTTTLSPKL